MNESNLPSLAYYLLLLLFVGSSAIVCFRGQTSKAISSFFIWGVIFMVLIGAYSFRMEFAKISERISAVLIPGKPVHTEDQGLAYYPAVDGHFYITASINGTPITFMVDTGASDIILTLSDAKKIGFQAKDLAFTKTYFTANGSTTAAPITLNTLTLDKLTLKGLPASINRGEMSHSLLGMRFLEHIGRYEFSLDRLTIWPK